MGPPLASLAEKPDSPMLFDLGNGSTTLIVTFASLGGASGIATFEFYKSLFDFDVDKLFVRDMTTTWYLQGIEGVSTSLTGTAHYLKELIQRHKYQRVVFLGYSMGGFAAIAHGVLAGADVVLAFGPQTFLDQANRVKAGDRRWSTWLNNLPDSIDPQLLDLRKVLDTAPHKTQIHIYCSAGCAIDELHAEHLEPCPQVTVHRMDDCETHMVAVELKKRGELYGIIRNALSLSAEDRLLGVWKELSALGLDAVLARHQVTLADFNDYREWQRDVIIAQQTLLLQFFAAIDAYIPNTFGLECVNDKTPAPFHHTADKCRRWFVTSHRSGYFGSFFSLPSTGLLLHLELGSHNLHIGLVRCIHKEDGSYDLVPLADGEYGLLLQALAPLKAKRLHLLRRHWGPGWCSIDCGGFHDPERYGTYLAMTNFPRSSLCRHTVTPFIETLLASEIPAVFQQDDSGPTVT